MAIKRRLRRGLTGAVLGALPGGIMVLLTFPLSGEVELSLGVMGIMVAVIGALIGSAVGIQSTTGGRRGHDAAR